MNKKQYTTVSQFRKQSAKQGQDSIPSKHQPHTKTSNKQQATKMMVKSHNNMQEQQGLYAARGDIVKIDWKLQPLDGFVPEPLFDDAGIIQFVLGSADYLPGLHELVQGLKVGDQVKGVSLDAGWGSRRDNLVFTVPTERLVQHLQKHDEKASAQDLSLGQRIALSDKISVEIVELHADTNTAKVDANPPLAGSSYECSLTVLDIQRVSTKDICDSNNNDDTCTSLAVATFALGCFWGAQLAFTRVDGVINTTVGYSQGLTCNPTYEEVCQGASRHREVVQVLYDSNQVSYEKLLETAVNRLRATQSYASLTANLNPLAQMYQEEQDEGIAYQYKNGFYHHNNEQREAIEKFLTRGGSYLQCFGIETLPASDFYQAEDYHQHYLYKGGQSTRKNCKDTIRCFG